MNLKLIVQVGILASFAASLSGCGTSWFANRESNPTIQDVYVPAHPFNLWEMFVRRRALNTFATTASRRMVIVYENDDGKVLTCAEPPPDVGEAFASSLSDELKVAVKEPKSGITGELANQFARAVSTHIAPLVYRTQGLQFYRDGLHSLCIDKMNGWLDGDTNDPGGAAEKYRVVKEHLIHEAALLIMKELPIMEKTQIEFYKNVKAGISFEDMKKMADIVKPVPTTTTSTPVPAPTDSTKTTTK